MSADRLSGSIADWSRFLGWHVPSGPATGLSGSLCNARAMQVQAHGDGRAAPDPADLLALAREQLSAGETSDAEATCRKALAVNAGNGEAHRLLGKLMQAQERGDDAVLHFAEAARLDPCDPKASRQLGGALAEEGRLAEAITALRNALEVRPGDVKALSILGRLKRFSPGDPDLAALEARVEQGDLEPHESIMASFTLAKAYEDVGDFERSFDSMRRANALQRATFEYDVEADVRSLGQIAATFGGDLLNGLEPSGSPSDVPVLIVGMPRSGTTLVEQILASHPEVHGGGELRHLQDMVAAVPLLNADLLPFPDGVALLDEDDLTRLGHGYTARLRNLAPDAARVVDKSNWNFKYLGLVRLIAPRAHVIHCVRNPIDTCLSSFGLEGRYGFGCDLEELGRYYRGYADLMSHWRAVLPAGWMLEVSYEALIDDLPGEVERILDHCGLEWNDACLAFHKTVRRVRTASLSQVRRPVYSNSVGRWRRYEPYLGPLVAALEHQPKAGAPSRR